MGFSFNPLHDLSSVLHTGEKIIADGANDFKNAMDDAAKVVTHMSPSQIGHTALDIVGMVPVVGTVANLANAGWYAAQGDWTDAAWSAAAAIPVEGDAVDALKLGKDAVGLTKDAATAERVAKDGEDAVNLAKDGEKIEGVAKDVKAEEKAANTVKADSNPAVATKISELGPKGQAAYDKIKAAIDRAVGRSAAEVRGSLSPDQIRAGQEEGPYLQRMFYGSSVENAVANDPAVLADGSITHLGTRMPGQKVPDFTISAGGKTFHMDITGPSESSLKSHLARPYVTDPSQVLTYPSPFDQFLKDVFK